MECIASVDWFWPAYWFGTLVYGTSLVQKLDFVDIAASYVAGFLWPVSLPASVLMRLMR